MLFLVNLVCTVSYHHTAGFGGVRVENLWPFTFWLGGIARDVKGNMLSKGCRAMYAGEPWGVCGKKIFWLVRAFFRSCFQRAPRLDIFCLLWALDDALLARRGSKTRRAAPLCNQITPFSLSHFVVRKNTKKRHDIDTKPALTSVHKHVIHFTRISIRIHKCMHIRAILLPTTCVRTSAPRRTAVSACWHSEGVERMNK